MKLGNSIRPLWQGINPTHETLSSWPSHLLKLSSHTPPWGLRFDVWILVRHKHSDHRQSDIMINISCDKDFISYQSPSEVRPFSISVLKKSKLRDYEVVLDYRTGLLKKLGYESSLTTINAVVLFLLHIPMILCCCPLIIMYWKLVNIF